jgi:hypothetical protein
MDIEKNDRVQEWGLIAGDAFVTMSRWWWYGLTLGIVLAIPAYFLFKFLFIQVIVASHNPPEIIYTSVIKQPLEIIDQKVFSLGENSYSGYVKIRNINLEWGTPSQSYNAEFKTLGGTLVTRVNGSAYILPASEKLIVFSRFTAETQPEVLAVTLDETRFIHKPDLSLPVELERINLVNSNEGTTVSAGIRNLSPFTINQISLPVALYNAQNQVVGVSSTFISVVRSGETRTFQYTWPSTVSGAIRAEITPELNIFDRNIISTDEGVSPF